MQEFKLPLLSILAVFFMFMLLLFVVMDLANSNKELAAFLNPIIDKYNECNKYRYPATEYTGIDNIGMIVGNISIENDPS